MNKILKNFVTIFRYNSYTCTKTLIPWREMQRFHHYRSNLQLARIWPLTYQRSREFRKSSINLTENDIKRILSLPGHKLKQFNIINSNDLLKTISDLRRYSDFVVVDHLQKLLQYIMTALDREHVPDTNIIRNFWDFTLSLSGLNFSEQFLCEFLEVCAKYSFPVSSQQIMTIMESNSISMNQSLGELLIANLCKQGRSEEAVEMIQTMTSLELNVANENIYSSLIFLKGVAKDLDGLSEILFEMKSAQVDMSPLTQCALVVAYHKCSSFTEAKKVLGEVAESETKFSSTQYKDILMSAVECGALDKHKEDIHLSAVQCGAFDKDESYLSYIVNRRHDVAGYVSLSQIIIHLLHANFFNEAVFLLAMEKDRSAVSHVNSTASAFIKELIAIKYNDPFVIIDFCDNLVRKNININAYEVALENALMGKHINLSWELLKAVKNRRDLKEHYFWPLFVMSKEDSDCVAKTLDTLNGMLELKVDVSSETLQDFIIPNLPLETPKLALQLLYKHGISKTRAISPLLFVLLRDKKFHEAVDVAKESLVPYNMRNIILVPLATAYQHEPTIAAETFLKLLAHSNESKLNKSNIQNRFISQICRNSRGKLKADEVELSILKINKDSLYLRTSKDYSSNRSSSSQNENLQRDVSDESQTELPPISSPVFTESYSDFTDAGENTQHIRPKNDETWTSSSPAVKSFLRSKVAESKDQNNQHEDHSMPESDGHREHFIHPSDMSLEELEAHLIELKAKNMNTRGVLRKLLLKHAQNKNNQRVQKITQELQALEGDSSCGMLSTALYSKVLESKAEEAVEIFYTLTAKFPKFTIDLYKIIDLCCLLARLGNVQESVKIMRDYVKITPIKSFNNKKGVLRNCHLLLTEISNMEGYSAAREMCSLLLTNGLAEASPVLFGPLIKSKLNRNDLIGAVEEAEELGSTYKVLPMRVEILVHLLKSKDDDLDVQSLVDRMCAVTANLRGHNQAKQDLLSASLQTYDMEQSARIFQHVERHLIASRVKDMCNYLVQMENAKALQIFLSISKGSSVVDRIYICESLLNIYLVNRKSKEALDLMTTMQEEALRPSRTFVAKLRTLLKATALSSS